MQENLQNRNEKQISAERKTHLEYHVCQHRPTPYEKKSTKETDSKCEETYTRDLHQVQNNLQKRNTFLEHRVCQYISKPYEKRLY